MHSKPLLDTERNIICNIISLIDPNKLDKKDDHDPRRFTSN